MSSVAPESLLVSVQHCVRCWLQLSKEEVEEGLESLEKVVERKQKLDFDAG